MIFVYQRNHYLLVVHFLEHGLVVHHCLDGVQLGQVLHLLPPRRFLLKLDLGIPPVELLVAGGLLLGPGLVCVEDPAAFLR